MKCAGCDNKVPPPRGPGRKPKWCSDRCRKRTLYSRECVDCGATCNTDGSVSDASMRCVLCANLHKRDMSRKWIIESMHEWEALFGAPPSAMDWNPASARAMGLHYKADRYEATGRPWPSAKVAQYNFGSWSAAREAAGYEANGVGCYGREGELVTVDDVAPLYAQGMSGTEIARLFGCSHNLVMTRVKQAGLRVRDRAEAVRLWHEQRRAA